MHAPDMSPRKWDMRPFFSRGLTLVCPSTAGIDGLTVVPITPAKALGRFYKAGVGRIRGVPRSRVRGGMAQDPGSLCSILSTATDLTKVI